MSTNSITITEIGSPETATGIFPTEFDSDLSSFKMSTSSMSTNAISITEIGTPTETLVRNSPTELDFVSVLGVCGLVGYEAEVNQCVGLCKDARTDYNLLVTVSKVTSLSYRRKSKHRMQYAVMSANAEWFETLFAVCNHKDIVNLLTQYNETLIHLLCGHRSYSHGDYSYEYRYVPMLPNYIPKSLPIFSRLVTSGIDLNIPVDTHDSIIGDSILMILIQSNNYLLFNELLKYAEKLDLNLRSETEGKTAFYLACELGRTAFVQRLCCFPNIDLRLGDYRNITPLQVSANNMDTYKVVFKALKFKERLHPNMPPETLTEFETAFRAACQCNAMEQVRWFCRIPNFRIDSKDSNGYTGFLLAANNGRLPVLKELADWHPDQVNVNSRLGPYNNETALAVAIGYKRAHIVKFLCAMDDINLDDRYFNNNYSVLGLAAEWGNLAIIDELLKYRDEFDIHHRTYSDETPLDIARRCNHEDMVKRLSSIINDLPYEPNDDDNTSLLVAVKNKSIMVLEELLKYGNVFDINTSNAKGETALHLACCNVSKWLPFGDGPYFQSTIDSVDNDEQSSSRLNLRIVKYLCAAENIDFQRVTDDGNTAYMLAAQFAQDSIVRELLKHREKYDINLRNTNGETMLSIACRNNRVDIVRDLCKIPIVDLNLGDNDGFNPLTIAAVEGFTDVIEELLQYEDRLDINHCTRFGRTALFLASENNQLNVVKLLSNAKGIDHNRGDNDDHTPFTIAAMNGHTDIIEELVKRMHYVDLNYRIKDGRTAFFLAAENNQLNVVKYFCGLKEIDCNRSDTNGHTPFTIAAVNGHTDIINELLQHFDRVDLNYQIKNNRSAIYLAVEYNQIDIVKLLCGSERIDINLGDDDGYSPLVLAVMNENVDAIDALLRYENRLDINHCTPYGRTSLFLAAQRNQYAAVELLSNAKGIDFNRGDNDGHTPFTIASMYGHSDIIEELLKHSDHFDPNYRIKDGHTALLLALENNQVDVMKLLCGSERIDLNLPDSNGDTPLIIAAREGLAEVTEELLRYRERVDVNFLNQNRKAAIHFACGYQNLEIVKLLCSTVPDITLDSVDRIGDTPLIIAAWNNCTDIVQELIKYLDRININHRNTNKETALYWAVRKNNLDTVKLLCTVEGMDWKIVNNEGIRHNKAPLQMALAAGKKEIARTLLKRMIKEKR